MLYAPQTNRGLIMDLSHWIGLATAAYAIHMIEEFMLDWRDYAREIIAQPIWARGKAAPAAIGSLWS